MLFWVHSALHLMLTQLIFRARLKAWQDFRLPFKFSAELNSWTTINNEWQKLRLNKHSGFNELWVTSNMCYRFWREESKVGGPKSALWKKKAVSEEGRWAWGRSKRTSVYNWVVQIILKSKNIQGSRYFDFIVDFYMNNKLSYLPLKNNLSIKEWNFNILITTHSQVIKSFSYFHLMTF